MTEPEPAYFISEQDPSLKPGQAKTILTETPISLSGQIIAKQDSNNGRREFRARLVRAGRIRRADGQLSNILIPAGVLNTAANNGQFEGIATFADHPGFFEGPKVKNLIGVVHSTYFNDATNSVDGVIRFYNGEDNPWANAVVDTLDMILADAQDGKPIPDVGLSIVFWPRWKPRENRDEMREIAELRKVDSADVVFGPAADGRILEALSVYAQEGGIEIMPEQLNTQPAVTEEESGGGDSTPQVEPTVIASGMLGNRRVSEPAEALTALNAWQDAAGQEAARAIIAHSQLPQISRERLAAKVWNRPDDLYKAIEDEREYLGQLTQSNVINLRGGAPRGADGVKLTTGLDQFENAINWLFGAPEAKMPEPQLRRMDLVYSMMTGDYEFHGVYNPERVFLAAANTTTLASMAANAMNKVIIAQLALLTHYRWYEFVVMPTPNDGTLHNMQWTSFGGIGTLPVVPEGGAYDELDVDDVQEADSFAKYGGYVGITREMIKNSDIQRIQAVPRALAAASVKSRSSLIASIFTSNSGVGPTLDQDSTALFHANHSNVATTALGTDQTAWRAAATEMFKHTEVNSSDRIGVFPKYCLVPPDLYHQALAVFGYGEGFPTSYVPEAQDRGIADPRPMPLAVPHFTDANDWAYIADPNVWPVIHMSFSVDPSGRTFPPPELWAATSETGGLLFAADVLPIKIRDEFAYGVNGFRGIGKRNVA